MAPPEHRNSAAHADYHNYLVKHELKGNPRLGKNVDRLSAWLEFLLHPETHDYDREVRGPFAPTGGTWVWREQPKRMYNDQSGHGEEYESRSVFHEYKYSDFLDPLVAVSTQHVEYDKNVLAMAAAAIHNIYWAGQQFTHELANFPSEWTGPAADEARRFVARLESVAGQLNLVVNALKDLIPKYGLVIKAARIDLDNAVAGLVDKFEEKFATESEGSSFSFDVTGFVLALVASAAVTYMTGGSGGAVLENLVVTAWQQTFDAATSELFREADKKDVGKIEGQLWKDLAKSYMKTVGDILRDGTAAINYLNAEMEKLTQAFTDDVPKFTDNLPEAAPPQPPQSGN